MKTYLVEDLFTDDPNDPANVIFNIPPEMILETGWKEGDTLNITVENGCIHLSKVDNK